MYFIYYLQILFNNVLFTRNYIVHNRDHLNEVVIEIDIELIIILSFGTEFICIYS